MANIMENRVDAILSADTVTRIYNNIRDVLNFLPNTQLLTLTESDREALISLDVDNKVFVEDAIAEVRNNGAGILPSFIQANQIQNDLTLFTQMDQLHSQVNNLMIRISDIRRIAASEAYEVSRSAYKLFGVAAQSGIANAQSSYDKLKERFKDQGRGGSGSTQSTI